jgi:hypothetical protein
MIKCNLSNIFSLLYKLIKLMHLDTGGKEIVFINVFSSKTIKTETTCNSLIIFRKLIDFRMERISKSFLYNISKYGTQYSLKDLVNVKHTL